MSFPVWRQQRYLDTSNFVYYINGTYADYADFGNILKSYDFDVTQLRQVFGELRAAGLIQPERLNGELDGFQGSEDFQAAADQLLTPGFQLFDAQKDGAEFLYGRQSAFLGDETGAGKCQVGSTRVVVNDQVWTLEDLWNKKAKRVSSSVPKEEWGDLDKNLLVHSINSDGELVQGKITNLFRERYKGRLRRITTSDGKICTTTFKHKFLKSSLEQYKNGESIHPFIWSNEIKLGDFILSIPHRPRLTAASETNCYLAEFFGWMIAEGYELDSPSRLSISQKDIKVLEHLKHLFEMFIKPNIKGKANPRVVKGKDRCPSLVLSSKSTRQYFESLGYKWGYKSASKRIPNFIMSASNAAVKSFLRAFFDAEAHAYKSSRRIEISSASKLLIFQLSQLLARFDILCSFSGEQHKYATNGTGKKRAYYRLYIVGNGVSKFSDEIGFGVSYKQTNLTHDTQPNSNKDGKPIHFVLKPFFDSHNLPFRLVNIPSKAYITGERRATDTVIRDVYEGFKRLHRGHVLKQYKHLPRSKWTSSTTEVLLDDKIQKDALNVIVHLRSILNSEFHYERVIAIEEVDFDGYVYDLSVEDHHNYVSENLISHNTIQAIVAADLRMRQSGGRGLIVTLHAVKEQWRREVAKFTGEGSISNDPTDGSRWTIVSYPMFSAPKKGPILTEAVKQQNYSVMILDEIQNTKNKSKRTERIHDVGQNIPFKWGLSATISANMPIDVWRQLKSIGHRLGDLSESGFRTGILDQRYLKHRFGGDWVNKGDTEQEQEDNGLRAAAFLNEWLTKHAGIYIRRTKQDINPNVSNHTVGEAPVELNKAQLKRLNAAIEERMQSYADPNLAISEMIAERAEVAMAKVPHSLELIDNVLAQDKKVLVFTCFRDTAAALHDGVEKLLKRYGGEVVTVIGGDKERQIKLDAFKNNPETRVMVLSILAGGTGIDLPNVVDDVIMNDYSWTPKDAEQAEGRAYRVTSESDVNTKYVIAMNTADEYFHKTVQMKRRLAAEIDKATDMQERLQAQRALARVDRRIGQQVVELIKDPTRIQELVARLQAEAEGLAEPGNPRQASSWLRRVL
ncbi:MAG: LAGLIDADG family homing endonuclease [Promethearchaeota archaeon]